MGRENHARWSHIDWTVTKIMGLPKVHCIPTVEGRSQTRDLHVLAQFVVEDQLKQGNPKILTITIPVYVSRAIAVTFLVYPGLPKTFEEITRLKAWHGYCEALHEAVPGYLHKLLDAAKPNHR